MISKDHIQIDADIQGGRPVIVGTRLTVDAIRVRVQSGDGADLLAADYPYVPTEVWDAAIAAWGKDSEHSDLS